VDHGHIHQIVKGYSSDGMRAILVVLAAGNFAEGRAAAAKNVLHPCLGS
jgi:hypothetical protein